MRNTYTNTAMELLEMFNAVVINDASTADHHMTDAVALNEKAMKIGYFVEPNAACGMVNVFLDKQKHDVNSTFYKEWEDVISRTRFEIFIDQVFHYMSTYGTDFSLGNGFTMNDGEHDFEFKFDNFKVITAITDLEMMQRCYNMLCSGIALKEDTVYTLCNYIYDVCYRNKESVDIDAIKNREARIILYDKFNMSPRDKFELIKYICYKATGSPMILKNNTNLRLLKINSTKFDFMSLTEEQINALSSIFYRYKDIILMFKNQRNSPVINKIRRLAVKNHQPMKVGIWENILNNTDMSVDEIYVRSAELNNYKLVTLINMLKENIAISAGDTKVYNIRNGKMFMKEFNGSYDVKRLHEIVEALNKRLVENLAAKSMITEEVTEFDPTTGENITITAERYKVVRMPKNLHIACPTSEKNFLGNIPFGSYINMGDKDNILGIYWRNEWGTHDFDLHMVDVNGSHIGWNAGYRNGQSIVYSGDMTNANPEATELFYFSAKPIDCTVTVNRFVGNVGSQFELFYACEKYNTCRDRRGHMCDPSHIEASAMLTSNDAQQVVGIISNGKFVFTNRSNGNARVTKAKPNVVSMMAAAQNRHLECMIDLAKVLEEAGYKVTTDVNVPCDIDLTDMKRDTLIEMFRNE